MGENLLDLKPRNNILFRYLKHFIPKAQYKRKNCNLFRISLKETLSVVDIWIRVSRGDSDWVTLSISLGLHSR